jgi:hypothetical protein
MKKKEVLTSEEVGFEDFAKEASASLFELMMNPARVKFVAVVQGDQHLAKIISFRSNEEEDKFVCVVKLLKKEEK